MPIDLYTIKNSPFGNAVRLVAAALKVDLNLIYVDLEKGEQLKPEFLKLNPQHTVPTLVDNGLAIAESRASHIYLVEKYGPANSGLYPSDAGKRALINQRLFFDLHTLYGRFADYFYPQLEENRPPGDEEKRKQMLEALGFLNTFLEGQKWVAGTEELSVADIAVSVSVSAYLAAGVDLAAYPNVPRWFEEFKKTAVGWSAIEPDIIAMEEYFGVLKN